MYKKSNTSFYLVIDFESILLEESVLVSRTEVIITFKKFLKLKKALHYISNCN